MVNELRREILKRLKLITGLTAGPAKPDDMITSDEVYFGYELTYSVESTNIEYVYNEYSITLTGRLVSKNKSIAIMDDMSNKIAEVLKDLRFKYTIQDVTKYDNINKMIINGHTSMNDVDCYLR